MLNHFKTIYKVCFYFPEKFLVARNCQSVHRCFFILLLYKKISWRHFYIKIEKNEAFLGFCFLAENTLDDKKIAQTKLFFHCARCIG